MEHSVYLESSIVDLKPRILEFLTVIVEKAKEVKDFAITLKRKELADLAGKDTRTVDRYLNELEDRDIIQTKGRRGRGGGTVIMFNTELIKFNTSDKALINSEEPVSIDDLMEEKFPKKKPKENNNKKRNRRTKQQMLEAEILNNELQKKNRRLNQALKDLGGVPNWEWFESTENPVDNYRTYLLTRLYNRYAVLFTDRHNAEVEVKGEGNKVPVVSNNYDVLPEDFYGSPRWYQFEKLRKFCEDNNLDPFTYLSAQFSRSVFSSGVKKNKKMLPYVNALVGDTAYEAYQQYCEYQKKFSMTYASYQEIPMQFMDDFVVGSMMDAYYNADSSNGFLDLRYALSDFFYGVGSGPEEEAMLTFYRMTDHNMKKKGISLKSRDVIKKYLVMQILSLTGGVEKLPHHIILSSEITRAMLLSINDPNESKETTSTMKALALGMITNPRLPKDKQIEEGRKYLYQFNVLYETPKVLKLIMERKKLHIDFRTLNEAFKEYGKDKIPVDDYSVLDTAKIIDFVDKFVEGIESEEEVDLEAVTQDSEWVLTGSVETDNSLEDSFREYMNSLED